MTEDRWNDGCRDGHKKLGRTGGMEERRRAAPPIVSSARERPRSKRTISSLIARKRGTEARPT